MHNFGADWPPERIERLARQIIEPLRCPDILAVQEVKAGAVGSLSAAASFGCLIEAVLRCDGPRYEFREIPPLSGADGGQTGLDIRSGFLFRPERVAFVDRGAAGPNDAVGIRRTGQGYETTLSPGRIAPSDMAFQGDPKRGWTPSRKALLGEFRFAGERWYLIACHLKSMRAANRRSLANAKKQRHAQAERIFGFVADVLACDPQAHIVVLGDLNDMLGSKTLQILQGGRLRNLVEELPHGERYSRRHGTRAQALDHILVSAAIRTVAIGIPHINSDVPATERASDHDPVWAELAPW